MEKNKQIEHSIAWWFKETLDNEEYSRAIYNTNTPRLDLVFTSFVLALFNAFVWAESPQGHEYWMEIYYKYR